MGLLQRFRGKVPLWVQDLLKGSFRGLGFTFGFLWRFLFQVPGFSLAARGLFGKGCLLGME